MEITNGFYQYLWNKKAFVCLSVDTAEDPPVLTFNTLSTSSIDYDDITFSFQPVDTYDIVPDTASIYDIISQPSLSIEILSVTSSTITYAVSLIPTDTVVVNAARDTAWDPTVEYEHYLEFISTTGTQVTAQLDFNTLTKLDDIPEEVSQRIYRFYAEANPTYTFTDSATHTVNIDLKTTENLYLSVYAPNLVTKDTGVEVSTSRELIVDITDYKIYMCSPPPMVNASIRKLESLGVKKENIKYESA